MSIRSVFFLVMVVIVVIAAQAEVSARPMESEWTRSMRDDRTIYEQIKPDCGLPCEVW